MYVLENLHEFLIEYFSIRNIFLTLLALNERYTNFAGKILKDRLKFKNACLQLLMDICMYS